MAVSGARVGSHRAVVPRLGFVALLALLGAEAPSWALDCSRTSIGSTPLDDLGAGLYAGQFQGGLYPGGSNLVPAAHAAAGAAAASAVVPLDLAGVPGDAGRIVLLSIGMSNTTDEFCRESGGTTGCTPESFMAQAAASSSVNHTTPAIVNGAAAGQDAATWASSDSSNYDRIRDQLLTPAGLSEAQVQAAWIKEADIDPTSSLPAGNADAYALESYLGQIVRALEVRYPNLRVAFLSSRIYAGYSTATLNPEPYAYESGFAVKWLIEAQIAQMASGGTQVDPRAGDLDYTTVAPWLAWGPYLWADGLVPRTDGLTWVCSDFASDGVHPAQAAVQKVGTMLLDVLLASPASRPWFVESRVFADGFESGDTSKWSVSH